MMTATQGRPVAPESDEELRTNTPTRATDRPFEDQSALGHDHHAAFAADGAPVRLWIFPLRRSISTYSSTMPNPCGSFKSCRPARIPVVPQGIGASGKRFSHSAGTTSTGITVTNDWPSGESASTFG